MKTIFILASVLLLQSTFGCAQSNLDRLRNASDQSRNVLSSGGKGLNQAEAGEAVKQALEKGAEFAVSSASKPDGFLQNPAIRIPFPPEANAVREFAVTAGLGNQVNEFEESLNRAAELASKEALNVLVSAVKALTLQDAMAILRGDANAATVFLERQTRAEIRNRFFPIVKSSVEQAQVARFYSPLANAHNRSTRLTGRQAVNPDLDDYVTEKALDGLFILLAQEEKNIRDNPAARTTDLLRRAFAN
ncbi:MAG: DUF4197 domain-containing protein [Luteibaculaceae bacterium]